MNTDRGRFYGFDIIRLIAFLAIIVFHSSWAIWVDPSGPPNPLPTFVWRVAEFYARCFAFSGFTIIFLSSLLIGFKSHAYKKNVWLPFFLVGAWILFSFCTFLKEKQFSLEWDIYPLLTVGLLSGRFLLRQKRYVQSVVAGLSILLLLIPLWEFHFLYGLPFYLGEILIGQCPQDYADWPILPWMGLMWLGMISGSLLREGIDKGVSFHFRKIEYAFGIGILVYFLNFRMGYFETQLGDGWSCYTFRQQPKVFWAHMLFWMSMMRLSLHPRINQYLKENPYVRIISRLQVNQNFYLAYLLHYVVLFALLGLLDPEQHARNLYFVDATLLLILPLTELTAHLLLKIVSSQKHVSCY